MRNKYLPLSRHIQVSTRTLHTRHLNSIGQLRVIIARYVIYTVRWNKTSIVNHLVDLADSHSRWFGYSAALFIGNTDGCLRWTATTRPGWLKAVRCLKRA